MKNKRLLTIIVFIVAAALLTGFAGINLSKTAEKSPTDDVAIEDVVIDSETSDIQVNNEETKQSAEVVTQTENIDVKTESALKNTEPEAQKTETINGKQLLLNFKETKAPVGIRVHSSNVYVAEGDSNVQVEYDSVTGQLIGYLNLYEAFDETKQISEDEAKNIAENFIKQYCDISKYPFARVSDYGVNNIVGYNLEYSRIVAGYKTREGIYVRISNDGKITDFNYTPYIFDNVNIDKIDEKPLLEKLDEMINKAYPNKDSYEITEKCLTVKDGNLIMQFKTVIKFADNPCTAGVGYEIPIE